MMELFKGPLLVSKAKMVDVELMLMKRSSSEPTSLTWPTKSDRGSGP